jgi:hypothetical protein
MSERGGEEKNSQPLTGLEPPIIQPAAQRYTTELCRLTMIIVFTPITKLLQKFMELFSSLFASK